MTRLVLISDTHNQCPILPEGDILVHAGDHTREGSARETHHAAAYLASQTDRFRWVVTIGGNHDWFMYHAHAEVMRGFFAPYSDRIVYLENEFAELEGIKFWGSPVQPEFCGWAWNEERGEEIRKTWAQIPNDIDVLVTHGPPMGILDWVGRTHVGCEELRLAIHRAQPKVHVFGHIHGAYGKRGIRYPETVYPGFYKATQFYNAAIVSDAYKLDPKHKPWVLDYDGTTFTEVTDAV